MIPPGPGSCALLHRRRFEDAAASVGYEKRRRSSLSSLDLEIPSRANSSDGAESRQNQTTLSLQVIRHRSHRYPPARCCPARDAINAPVGPRQPVSWAGDSREILSFHSSFSAVHTFSLGTWTSVITFAQKVTPIGSQENSNPISIDADHPVRRCAGCRYKHHLWQRPHNQIRYHWADARSDGG